MNITDLGAWSAAIERVADSLRKAAISPGNEVSSANTSRGANVFV